MSSFDQVMGTGSTKDLLLVYGAHVATTWADWVSFVGALVLLHAVAPQPSLAIAGFIVVRLLSPPLFAPLAHIVAVSYEKRRVMAACNLFGSFVVLGYLGIKGASHLSAFYVVTVLQQALFALYDPTRRALVPEVCNGEEGALTMATAADALLSSLAMCIGALSGGALASSKTGLPTNFACAAAALATAAGATLLVSRPASDSSRYKRSDEDENGGYAALASTGAAYLLGSGQRRTLRLLCVKASAALAWGMSEVLEVTFAALPSMHRWGGVAATLGLLYLCAGAGSLAGPVLVGSLTGGSERSAQYALVGALGTGAIAAVVLVCATSVLPLLLASFLRASAVSVVWTYSTSLVQRSADQLFHARVFAFELALFTSAKTTGLLVAGALLEKTALRDVTGIMLTLSIAVSGGWALYFKQLHKEGANSPVEPAQNPPTDKSALSGPEEKAPLIPVDENKGEKAEEV
jgi:hypothetical protein